MRMRIAWKIALQQYGAHVYKAHRRWLAQRRVKRAIRRARGWKEQFHPEDK
jgi:hypothetical protein